MDQRKSFFQASSVLLLILLALGCEAHPQSTNWSADLQESIEQIDQSFPGTLGVYIRHLGDDQEVAHNVDQDWYLASTIKIHLAIALMQRAEEEGLDLEQKLTLRASDYVDGAGDLLWVEPGARYSLNELNKRSIADSDSTATDMLIRFLGEESFNEQAASMVPEGLGPITTILQVRYDAYSEIHPDASLLSNRDFITLRTANTHQARYQMLLEKLGISEDEANAGSLREAFERYYQRGINSGSLQSFAYLLERLVRGELVNDTHTKQLIGYLSEITTGDRRIKGGLISGAHFAHKTGTQIARSCDIGVLNPSRPEQAVIVAVCARDYEALSEAEKAYQAIGKALSDAGLVYSAGSDQTAYSLPFGSVK